MSADVAFSQPTIGPKVYVAKGPSGWIETFPRAKADKSLATFTLGLDLVELVDMFVTARQLANTPTDWYTVTGFLGRTMQCSPKAVPTDAAVAFWAHVVLALTTTGAN